MSYSVLVVDDEADIRNLICDVLTDEGYETRVASGDLEAFTKLDEKVPTAVILDIWLQGSELDGLGILEIIKKKYPYLPVIMISGHGNIETAVNALKMGAYDYIEKPFTEDKLLIIVKRSCEFAKLQKENSELRMYTSDANRLIGNSNQIVQLKQLILKVAPTSSRVLVTGPNGSGKKLVAKLSITNPSDIAKNAKIFFKYNFSESFNSGYLSFDKSISSATQVCFSAFL